MMAKKLNITAISFIYNEMLYLPLKYFWIKEEGIKWYVIDNMSTDGSWEWLQERKVPSHRLDTDGAFDLDRLNAEVIAVVHRIKPDWIVYIAPDTFFITPRGLQYEIKKADAEGYHGIMNDYLAVVNTGEKMESFDPINTYFYSHLVIKQLRQITKYSENVKIIADDFTFGEFKSVPGCHINYGNTKGLVRNELLRRRAKAWERGLNPAYGGHYKAGNKLGWMWGKEGKIDIRKYYPECTAILKKLMGNYIKSLT